MRFDEYQEFAKATDLYPPEEYTELMDGVDPEDKHYDLIARLINLVGNRTIEYRTLCLSGEIGELANKVKKIRRDSDGLTEEIKASMIHEMGDGLWYLASLCTLIDVELGEVARLNIKMLSSRKERGTIRGSGDNR